MVHASDSEPSPLTQAELAALQSFGKGFAPDQLAQDADTIFSALSDAISPPPASDSEPVEPVENSECKSKYGESGCRIHGGGLRAAHKGSRSSRGNPRAKTTQSNTPLKSAPAANPQIKVNAIDHALKSTQKGGKVESVAKIGGRNLTIEHGKPGIKSLDYKRGFGSSHQYAKHGEKTKEKTTPRKAASTLVHGKRSEDKEHGTIAHELGSHVAFSRPLKKGESTFQTAHKTD